MWMGILAGCSSASSQSTVPSVLMISLDTFRADRLASLGNPDGLTPNLDAFAAESVVFDQAYAQSDLTSMSHASLFTSRYPSELGPVYPDFRLGDVPTLASILSVYGYVTAAFTAGGHMAHGTGLDRGFSTFEATKGLGSFWSTVPAALKWLDHRSADAPFFLFVHSYDTHMPYLKPPPYGLGWTDRHYQGSATAALKSPVGTALIFDHTVFQSTKMIGFLEAHSRPRTWDAVARAKIAEQASNPELQAAPFGEADAAQVVGAYNGAAAYADAWFGYLMDGLKSRGLYDRLTIVVLSDHGEALGEEGRFGHGDSLDDRILHVPLIVHGPGYAPRHVPALVGLVDVLPTLLEAAGAKGPAGMVGHSLLPWLKGADGPAREYLFAEGTTRMISVRSPKGRLTFSGISADSAYATALLRDTPLDSPAFVEATTAPPEEREALRQQLLSWRSSIVSDAHGQATMSPEQVEHMRNHGYWNSP